MFHSSNHLCGAAGRQRCLPRSLELRGESKQLFTKQDSLAVAKELWGNLVFVVKDLTLMHKENYV